MKVTRRDFNKAGIGALSLAALGGGNALAAPDPLIRKAIPSSGELVPVIGLGTNRYGVGDDAGKRALLRAALMRFRELGGTVIDTAPMYRSSEAVLGDLIADLAIRDDLFIATKADEEPGGAEAETIAAVLSGEGGPLRRAVPADQASGLSVAYVPRPVGSALSVPSLVAPSSSPCLRGIPRAISNSATFAPVRQPSRSPAFLPRLFAVASRGSGGS